MKNKSSNCGILQDLLFYNSLDQEILLGGTGPWSGPLLAGPGPFRIVDPPYTPFPTVGSDLPPANPNAPIIDPFTGAGLLRPKPTGSGPSGTKPGGTESGV